MALVADTLFSDGDNTVTLRGGRTVTVKPAKMKQLSLVMKLFQRLLESLDKHQLADLIDLVSFAQKAAIDRGDDPRKVDVSFLASEQVVEKAFGNISLLMGLVITAIDMVPALAEAFCDLSVDEYGDLDADEGTKIIGAVFLLNYHFFSQSLPPMLMAFTRSWSSQSIKAANVKTMKKPLSP